MTTPATPDWPLSWPSQFGETELDKAAEAQAPRLERVKAYDLEAPGIYCETTRLGESWYTTVRTGAWPNLTLSSVGIFPDHHAALDALHQAIDEHLAHQP